MRFSRGISFTPVLPKVPIQMVTVPSGQFRRESSAARTALHATIQGCCNCWLFTVKENNRRFLISEIWFCLTDSVNDTNVTSTNDNLHLKSFWLIEGDWSNLGLFLLFFLLFLLFREIGNDTSFNQSLEQFAHVQWQCRCWCGRIFHGFGLIRQAG